jgi:hypothetical protein
MGLLMSNTPFWEKKHESEGKKRHMSREQVQHAKASARAHGRPWPNLVDNVTAMRTNHKRGK